MHTSQPPPSCAHSPCPLPAMRLEKSIPFAAEGFLQAKLQWGSGGMVGTPWASGKASVSNTMATPALSLRGQQMCWGQERSLRRRITLYVVSILFQRDGLCSMLVIGKEGLSFGFSAPKCLGPVWVTPFPHSSKSYLNMQ